MEKVLIDPFREFLDKVAGFLPHFLTSVVLIAAGIVIAWLLKTIISRLAAFLKLDALSERFGLVQILQKGGIREPVSKVSGKIVYWVVLISFIIMGLDSLQMPAVEDILSSFLLYLPNVIVAGLLILLGYLLGNFLGRTVLIACVNAGLAFAGLLAKFVKFTVFIMTLTMALELLGIGEDTVLIAFAVVFGGVVLALSIAFGLGGRDAAREYIDRMLKEKEKDDDISHI